MLTQITLACLGKCFSGFPFCKSKELFSAKTVFSAKNMSCVRGNVFELFFREKVHFFLENVKMRNQTFLEKSI